MHRSIPRLTWFLPAIVAIAGLLAAPSAHAEGKKDSAKTTRAAKNRIGAVTFDDAGQQTTIRVRGTSTPTFTVYKLERPNRVVVDIAGATLGDAVREAQENGATIPVGTWAVNQLAAYEIDDGGSLVRVVVTLARPGRYDVKAKDGDVVVTVTARDAAPAAPDAREVEAAQKAAEQAKKDSEAAKAARTKAEADAGKARAQADASKQEAERAKKALADAQAAAKKASQAQRERADRALAEAKAEADRTRKAADAANAARERADRAVAEAKAEADRTREAAVEAREQVARMQAELDAAKAEAAKRAKEAKAARADADRHKQAADAARADAARQKQEADDAEAQAAARTEEAKRASADAARNKEDAAAARADAEAARKAAARLEAEAKAAKAEAAKAKADAAAALKAAEQAQRQAANATADADAARADAAARKRDADAAKRDAEDARRDAKAIRAEAEKMLAEAKTRVKQAEADARAAKQDQARANDALAKAERKSRAAQQAADRAAAERKAAQAALEAAKKSDDDAAAKKVAEAEARLARAEKARRDAEAQKAAAENAAATARAEADRRKAETDEAARARAAAEQDREAAQAAAEEASARATRAEKLRKDEEAAARRAAAAKAEADAAVKAKKDQDEIDAKRAEAKKLAAAAEQAKKARVSEEEQLAAIVAERRAAEADVAKARAEAAAARKDAAQAVAKAEAAKREADEAERRAKAARDEAAAAKAAPKPATRKAKQTSIAITDIGFQQHGDDARVTIALGGDVEPSVHASGNRAEMILDGVSLPKKLERKLDTSKFKGPVRAISSYRDSKDASKVHVVVELAPGATPRLEQVGSGKKTALRWHFAAPTVAKKAGKPTKKVRTESIPAPKVGGYGASSTPVTSRSVAQAGGRRKVYRGPTIDLDFKDADIHNLLRFLANIGRVSIVVPDDIKATVTVRLKRVPWDQALEVILASKDLWYRKEGNLYRVAPRKKLDEEDEAEAERIRAAVQAEVPEAEVFTLGYASAEETAQKLQPLLSPKGRIEVDSRTNSLIISDIRAHRSRVRDLAARLDIQTPQIMIEARIVEARSTYARDLGIQWGGNANMSQAGGNATGLIFPNSISVAGGNEDRQTPLGGVSTPSNFAVNLPAQTGTGAGAAVGMNLGSVGGNFNLAFRLSALEDTGTVRIISQPKITVLNNAEAVISQGVSIPISVVSATGTQTQFVPADLSLTVTPYVSQSDCAIAMDVNVTKNEPDFVNTGARGDPTILRKEARTKILVADGETTVMGGITTRNTGLSYNKVPFFGDLPVLGWLFKRRRENDDRTELLIFITPRITNKAFLRCE